MSSTNVVFCTSLITFAVVGTLSIVVIIISEFVVSDWSVVSTRASVVSKSKRVGKVDAGAVFNSSKIEPVVNSNGAKVVTMDSVGLISSMAGPVVS